MKSTDDLGRLEEVMADGAGKCIAVKLESARVVAYALHVYAAHLARPCKDHHPFTVDVFDDHGRIIETMAQCSSLLVGRASGIRAGDHRAADAW